ncbi:MAG: hypothetical protein Q7R53_01320 [bacterium]|nr:hypothetical protein [bacterium]
MLFGKKKTHYQHLREKLVKHHQGLHKRLWKKHGESLKWLKESSKQLVVGSAATLMLLNPATALTPAPQHNLMAVKQLADEIPDKSAFVILDLRSVLPSEIRPLIPGEEQVISEILSRDFGIKVSAELEGKKLNRSYGLIGAEQHLARFPGDNMSVHFDTPEEARLYTSSGMAPGLGGWGYFTTNGEFTEKDKLKEKYYIAVPTFLAPGFSDNPHEIINFFKHRKMLVVNPENGKAVVTVVGDAGPAEWTGKHLGGSPEVMSYLNREDGSKKGPVLYFFIDDPENKVPLGPIESYNKNA